MGRARFPRPPRFCIMRGCRIRNISIPTMSPAMYSATGTIRSLFLKQPIIAMNGVKGILLNAKAISMRLWCRLPIRSITFSGKRSGILHPLVLCLYRISDNQCKASSKPCAEWRSRRSHSENHIPPWQVHRKLYSLGSIRWQALCLWQLNRGYGSAASVPSERRRTCQTICRRASQLGFDYPSETGNDKVTDIIPTNLKSHICTIQQ